MTCCWCNGDHKKQDCHRIMSTDAALEILGPIRAAKARRKHWTGKKLQGRYWLDGRVVDIDTMKKEAKRVKNGKV